MWASNSTNWVYIISQQAYIYCDVMYKRVVELNCSVLQFHTLLQMPIPEQSCLFLVLSMSLSLSLTHKLWCDRMGGLITEWRYYKVLTLINRLCSSLFEKHGFDQPVVSRSVSPWLKRKWSHMCVLYFYKYCCAPFHADNCFTVQFNII